MRVEGAKHPDHCLVFFNATCTQHDKLKSCEFARLLA